MSSSQLSRIFSFVPKSLPIVTAIMALSLLAPDIHAQFTEQQKFIVPGDGATNDGVALSYDGTVVAVGSSGRNGVVNGYSGGVAVWRYDATSGWSASPNIVQGFNYPPAPAAPGVYGQGISVALDSSGKTMIFGGIGDADVPRGSNDRMGAAWLYVQSETGAFTYQAKLVGTGAIGRLVCQGASVALSADGMTAVVGAPCDNWVSAPTDEGAGAAWVFSRGGPGNRIWTQVAKLTANSGDNIITLGRSVSTSRDGRYVVVSGATANKIGLALIYEKVDGAYVRRSTLSVSSGSAPEPNGNGVSVGINYDGNLIVVGDGVMPQPPRGAAWLWRAKGSAANRWATRDSIHLNPGPLGVDFLGRSVAVATKGNDTLVAAGAPYTAYSINDGVGNTRVWTGASGTASALSGEMSWAGVQANQGHRVGISGNARTLIIGRHNGNGVWLFQKN